MQENSKEVLPRHILNTKEAADYLGLSHKTLEAWRCRGGGPEYVKQGRSVRYPLDYLDRHIEKATRTSTSDRGRS